ncbi:MAG: GreA/GreB family elongation factor [Pseudolabrys sp.]
MDETSLPPVSIPVSDRTRLESVVREAVADRHPVAGFLASELLRAEVFAAHELPADTVTLNGWVTYRTDGCWLPESRLLVCPNDYRSAAIHLSVLSPLGAALIGLRVGSRISYRSIAGALHTVVVEGLDAPQSARVRTWAEELARHPIA